MAKLTPEKEKWQQIDDTRYEVSSLGRVRHERDGASCRKLHENRYGYQIVTLSVDSGFRTIVVHREVAKAFLEPEPEDQPEVNHINGEKTDNRAVNLEWASRVENERHAWRTGLKKAESQQNENNNAARFTNKEVMEMYELHDLGMQQRVIAEIYGTGTGHINRIVNGKRYQTLHKQFYG